MLLNGALLEALNSLLHLDQRQKGQPTLGELAAMQGLGGGEDALPLMVVRLQCGEVVWGHDMEAIDAGAECRAGVKDHSDINDVLLGDRDGVWLLHLATELPHVLLRDALAVQHTGEGADPVPDLLKLLCECIPRLLGALRAPLLEFVAVANDLAWLLVMLVHEDISKVSQLEEGGEDLVNIRYGRLIGGERGRGIL